MMCPYATLGVSKNYTQEELKKAYAKRVRQTHPDLTKQNTEMDFVRVQDAYHRLLAAGPEETELDGIPYMVIEIDAAINIKCRCGTIYEEITQIGPVECTACSHYIEIIKKVEQ